MRMKPRFGRPLPGIAALAVVLGLAAAPLAPAAPAEDLRAPAPTPAAQEAAPTTPEAPTLAWTLESAAFAAEWADVRLQVFQEDALVLEERFEAQRDPRGGPVRVELLGRSPKARELYVELDRRDLASVEAVITVDGIEAARRPLAELALTTNRDLAAVETADRPAPFANLRFARSEPPALEAEALFAQAQDCSARNACRNDCLDDYYLCQAQGGQLPLHERICLPDDPNCNDCLGALAACQQSCPACVCIDPKNVDTENRTYLVGTYFYGSWCRSSPFGSPPPSYYYDDVQYNYRRDTVEVTEYCNGTTSEQVLSSQYFSNRCDSNTYIPCSFPIGTAWGFC